MPRMRSLEAAPSSLYDDSGSPRFGAYRGALPPVDLGRLAASKLDLVTKRKRWFYVGVATDEVFVAAAAVHVGYVATAFAFVYDRKERRLLADRSTLAPPFGQRFSGTAGEGCDIHFSALGARFDVQRGLGAKGYDLDVAIGDITFGATLDEAAAPPISVVAPVPGGTVNATEKRALLPCRGEVAVGKRRFRLEGGLGGFDYTQGLLARRTAWKWAFALGRAKTGEKVAMNLVEGFIGEGECAVWVDDRLYPVGEGRFTFDAKRPLEPWQVKTACGAVDLVFSPGGMHAEDKNFGVISSRSTSASNCSVVHLCRKRSGLAVRIAAPLRSLDGVLCGVTEDQDVLW